MSKAVVRALALLAVVPAAFAATPVKVEELRVAASDAGIDSRTMMA